MLFVFGVLCLKVRSCSAVGADVGLLLPAKCTGVPPDDYPGDLLISQLALKAIGFSAKSPTAPIVNRRSCGENMGAVYMFTLIIISGCKSKSLPEVK